MKEGGGGEHGEVANKAFTAIEKSRFVKEACSGEVWSGGGLPSFRLEIGGAFRMHHVVVIAEVEGGFR